MPKTITIAIFLFLSVGFGFAQPLNKIKGTVTDQSTKEPISYAGISIEGQVPGLSDEPSKIDELVSRWRAVHATHVSINTLNQGMRHLDEHLEALEVSARVLGLTPR